MMIMMSISENLNEYKVYYTFYRSIKRTRIMIKQFFRGHSVFSIEEHLAAQDRGHGMNIF